MKGTSFGLWQRRLGAFATGGNPRIVESKPLLPSIRVVGPAAPLDAPTRRNLGQEILPALCLRQAALHEDLCRIHKGLG